MSFPVKIIEIEDSIFLGGVNITTLLSTLETTLDGLSSDTGGLQSQIDGINTILQSDNLNLDTIQELVDALELLQTGFSNLIVDDLVTGGSTKALSAQQGVVLKGLIDTLTSAVALNTTHRGLTNNPHNVTQTQVGLGNVNNTSDLNKPISTATQTALNLKYDAANPNGYETPSQLNTRDTNNRNRNNHTGTQLANTISDFANTVRATLLTGLGAFTNVPITAADSILSASSRLQGQINNLSTLVSGIQTLLSSDNVDLDTVQELVDAIETLQTSLATILVNDLVTGGTTKALTAQQGVVLKGLVDGLQSSKANIAGQVFTGNISAPNLSNTNTGDETTLSIQTKRPLKTVNGNSLEGTGDIPITAIIPFEYFARRLTATQAQSGVGFVTLNTFSFEIPAGHSGTFWGVLIFTSANTTTGVNYGINVLQQTGNDGNAAGSFSADVTISSSPAATALQDGDVINVAQNVNTTYSILGTSTTAGNNSAKFFAQVTNLATNGSTFVSFVFASETAGTAVTAQINSTATAIIGLTQ